MLVTVIDEAISEIREYLRQINIPISNNLESNFTHANCVLCILQALKCLDGAGILNDENFDTVRAHIEQAWNIALGLRCLCEADLLTPENRVILTKEYGVFTIEAWPHLIF